ncbi:bifunctional diguanylate cyclase/phosphodiesterase [Pseudomonas sp. S32]|uniref:bifunctional diguanylate cyclase/phosphodiesterase n=1 Tax=Pseudomonas sp. S32 TaxID=2767448 RepID=UPI001913C4C6|nr:sensor domain-containing phosphodiesterase [Pseudomonas sp. S32]MBK5005534.1 sensor domain-containing phosphodiesterase [Pseudomonas sp. S32]
MDNLTILQDERLRLVEVDRLTSELAGGSDPVLNSIVNMLCAYFDVPTVLVSVVDRDYQVFKAKIGLADDRTPREVSICAHGLWQESVLEICDTLQDARTVDNPLVQASPHIRYYAGAPLVIRPGVSLGGLCIIDHEARPALCERDRNLLSNAARVVVERLQSIHQQNFYDPMTGLPNRRRFEADFKDAAALTGQVAIFIEPISAAGMDSLFKALGIEFFTNFMLAVKEILMAALPEGCRLYRPSTLGFMTVVGACDASVLGARLGELVRSLSGPLHSGNVPVVPDVGISVLALGVDVDPSLDILRLMASMTDAARKADQRWLAYDPVVDASLRRNTAILNALEAALAAPDQLSLVYQPRMDLNSNRCVAVEALLRWVHPTLGQISPAEFIPLAETTASIRGITRWVIRQVCQQIADWRAHQITLQVSLNISALDLGDGQLYDDLNKALAEYDVSPAQVELEFTESALVTDFDTVHEQLQRFRALGVAIGIDDFGSGYSNWIYLRKIPATSVKLDRSLLVELQPGGNDWHIVRGLVSLLRDLRLTVVAEGVETDLHHHVLRGWGCDQGQGYYYARPMPATDLAVWLQQGRQT